MKQKDFLDYSRDSFPSDEGLDNVEDNSGIDETEASKEEKVDIQLITLTKNSDGYFVKIDDSVSLTEIILMIKHLKNDALPLVIRKELS
jgi:hypothetical protein